ncbi:hypothetical protein BD626DRAFT_513849, partial [Schizophyllum amplum]
MVPTDVFGSSLSATLSDVYEELLQRAGNIAYDEICNIERMSLQLNEAARYARNLSAPINRLPDEVLEIIFHLAQPYNAGFVPSWPISTTWSHRSIAATHVCRRWRDIALESPSLWSVVDLCKERRLGTVGQDFLRRSGTMPLTVFYYYAPEQTSDQSSEDNPPPVMLIRNLRHRIARLHIGNIAICVFNLLFSRPLLSLDVLSLCGVTEDLGWPEPDTPFADLTPRLR